MCSYYSVYVVVKPSPFFGLLGRSWQSLQGTRVEQYKTLYGNLTHIVSVQPLPHARTLRWLSVRVSALGRLEPQRRRRRPARPCQKWRCRSFSRSLFVIFCRRRRWRRRAADDAGGGRWSAAGGGRRRNRVKCIDRVLWNDNEAACDRHFHWLRGFLLRAWVESARLTVA